MVRLRAFTLMELMVVVIIVAILAAVMIPIMQGRIDSAKWSEGRAMAGTIKTAIKAYYAERGVGAAELYGVRLWAGRPGRQVFQVFAGFFYVGGKL